MFRTLKTHINKVLPLLTVMNFVVKFECLCVCNSANLSTVC